MELYPLFRVLTCLRACVRLAQHLQVGFYDVVGVPLFRALASAFPGTQPLLLQTLTNYNIWHQIETKAKQEQQAAVPPSGGSGTLSKMKE